MGGRGSTGGNSPSSGKATARNIAENAERIRERTSTEATARREVAEAAKGNRSWKPTQDEVHRDVSYARAENQYYNAPVGTTITMESRDGDYIGEYTRTANGWAGRQRYKSSYEKPKDVKTAKGFASAITGRDIRVTATRESNEQLRRQAMANADETEARERRESFEAARNMRRRRS